MTDEKTTPPHRAKRPRRLKIPPEKETGADAGRDGQAREQQPTAGPGDDAYIELRQAERVVMRHQISLNLDAFRAAPDGFNPRPRREHPRLQVVHPPFASVIIPNKDGMRFLPGLLAALANQTFADFEVILVDDASGDDSVAWTEANHPWVRLLVHRRNRGFVAACNDGAAVARGRVLLFLNNDTEPEVSWLAETAKAVCAHPEAAVFASKILLFGDRDILHTAGDLLGTDGIPTNRGVWQKDAGQFDRSPEVFSGSGGAVAYRREVWQALGGFDPDFWMYLEDVDFGFRAQLMGWKAVFVPSARVYHHLTATAGGVTASYYVGRNTIWMLVKNMPASLLARNLTSIVAAQARITVDALRSVRGEAARARLMGQAAGIAGVPRQLWKRRLIQSRRTLSDTDLAQQLCTHDE